ncbi:hypothetical protein O181_034483 [Austropuccinia psidii MF-1]|uniref:Histone-lysine N-methyltransferase, H3 lysine-36 specific n=1 Tax=Austropuccinia psidii MF-1 TaxID=1389203 RepID=A0A9Q3H7E0_9BASI|nr:hypothetical protein [Austropuccinia psidii MF-1]
MMEILKRAQVMMEEEDASLAIITPDSQDQSTSTNQSPSQTILSPSQSIPPPSPSSPKLDSPSFSNPPASLEFSHVKTYAGKGRRPKGKEKATKESVPEEIQFIDHLPEATQDALKTFTLIDQNIYQNKSLGLSKQPEDAMVCDCSWSNGDDPDLACGPHNGCINYLTQIECIRDRCRCRHMCRNQRFQNRQYASTDIVLTEKKGFGIRVKESLPVEAFICEYLGEVVGFKSFQRRMKDYSDEGLKHFYFMQLQGEEYIDATKKGGTGRFLNHSCNPNCYIGKWVVGRQMRMGIFTKRAVKSGEELTFNYNVDRYGHEAQECHCGEPNCVGYLGGKTQTDLGAMDDLYIDALGIVDDVENLTLKGSKTKRSKRMDIDYVPIMKPIPLRDVPKVASAIRQSISNKRILTKLLRRIMITEDSAIQKQLMRLHGFSVMSMILNEHLKDQEIVKTTLEILLKWPLITKNKLVSTNIEETVMKLSENPSEIIQTLAAELVKMWVALEVSYRIPKDKKQAGEDLDGSKRKAESLLDQIFSKRLRDDDGSKEPGLKLVSEKTFIRPEAAKPFDPLTIKPENLQLPHGWSFERTVPDGRPYYYHSITRQSQWEIPTAADVARVERELAEFFARQKAAANDVEDIIAKAKAEAEALRSATETQKMLEAAENDKLHAMKQARREKHGQKQPLVIQQKRKDKERSGGISETAKAIKDRKILRLFSAIVVQTMSRYKASLDRDQFKKRAKELTNLLCQKETRSIHYLTESYDQLTADKEAKIKSFTKDWTMKLLARKELFENGAHPHNGVNKSMTNSSDLNNNEQGSSSGPGSEKRDSVGGGDNAQGFHINGLANVGADLEEEYVNDDPDNNNNSSASSHDENDVD